MKIKDLNNTIINAMIQTGTVIDCKEGYMEITQQNLSEPTLTISVPSTVTVGTPTTITVTASVSGSIVLYINQEYIGLSEGSATYQYVYTPQDTFTIEAYYTSQYGTVANTAKEVIPSTTPTTYAVQSTDSQGDNYNPIIQQWAYTNGYAANEGYTTMEEAALVTSLEGNAFANSNIDHIDELTNFNITSIDNGAFTNCDSLTSAVLPSGITTMGTGIFSGCATLASVTIPDSVTSMGNEIFAECPYLSSVTLSSGITTIPDSTFQLCVRLQNLTIPSGVTSIGNLAFKQSGLTSINVPNGVTSIGEEAFAGCDFLSSVTLPTTLRTISHLAFDECSSLKNITIPNGVITLGNEVFEQTGLTSIIIPSSITSVGQGTFYQCTSLSSVTFAEPSGISTLTTGTFAGCSALTSLTLPSGITTIGEGGVQDCRNLRTVTLPSTLTSVGQTAFYLDSSLTEVWCYATTPPSLGNYAFYSIGSNPTLYVPSASVSAYQNSNWANYFSNILPISTPVTYACQSIDSSGANYNPALQIWSHSNGYSAEINYTTKTEAQAVTMIEANAFNNNTNLTSINELQYFTNLSIINDYAFRGTANLTTGILPPSVNDIYVGAFQNSGIQALNPRMPYDPTDYTKGASNVTASNVSRYAFAGSNLTSVTFGRYTTTVGASAFEGCLYLRNVYGEDSGWISVQNNTFKNCSMLKNIYLPSTVTMLLSNVVDGCAELEAIYCYATTPPSITASTFTNMASDVTLYVPSESLTAYQNSNWANYFSNILPTSAPTPLYAVQSTDSSGVNYNPVFQQWLYSNGYSAHSGYTTMAETLNLTEIPERAFTNNTSLTHMDELQYFIKLTSIGDEAFRQCTNLTSIIIPNSVRQIGCESFDNCRGLTNIIIPNSVTSIGNSAFYLCTGLTNIIIPDSVTSIGDLAFDLCQSLKTITIGSGVTFIGEYAFYECPLSNVYCYANTPPTLEGDVFYRKSFTNLYVPGSSKYSYQITSGWQGFKSYNAI